MDEKVKKIKLTPELANRLFNEERKKLEWLLNEKNKIENTIINFDKTINTLKAMEKKPEEMMVNIGSGVLMEATPKNIEKVKVHIGGDVFVEKNIKDAIKILEERRTKATKDLEELRKLEKTTEQNLNQLYNYLMSVSQQKQNEKGQ